MNVYKIKNLIGLSVVLLCLSAGTPLMANSHSVTENTFPILGDKFIGGWSYTVEGAPEGYTDGLLVIVKEGGDYKVQVQIGGGTLLGENVTVNGSTINFDVMVEGGKVAVSLTVKGDTITGKSTSAEGSLMINGTKTISMD